MTATMTLEPSQTVKKRVRNVLFCGRQPSRAAAERTSSSRVGFSTSSCGSNGAMARLTVCSNAASTSSWAASATSATAGPLPSLFLVSTVGSVSALSEPLVPQLTSCRLARLARSVRFGRRDARVGLQDVASMIQQRTESRTHVNDGAMSRYCGILWRMCQGSRSARSAPSTGQQRTHDRRDDVDAECAEDARHDRAEATRVSTRSLDDRTHVVPVSVLNTLPPFFAIVALSGQKAMIVR